MTRSSGRADHEAASAPRLPLRLRDQLSQLAQGLARSPERRTLVWLSLAVLGVILATAAAQVALNAWNTPFYNAISVRDGEAFLHQLGVFFVIAGALLVLNVVQMWLSLTVQLKLRAGLMHDLLDLWLEPLRAFRLAHAGTLGVNPDQRLHEDTRHLTELSTTLAIALLQASILLAVFAVVLWRLSVGFAFVLAGHRVAIPGYMLWAAIAYALIGSLASFRVGYSLIGSNAERYGREAELRTALVRVSDNIGTIALHRGEGSERRLLEGDLGHVLDAMRKLVTATTKLTWITAGYGWLTQVVPIMVAAPVYFNGQISFGEMMMAVGAFNQVQSSLRWFVDNFGAIADWRATLLRVADFRRAVLAGEELHPSASKIVFDVGEPGRLVLDHVAVASNGECTTLDEPSVEIAAGDRVQISGDSGDAQTIFFRALAGLWPWGEGRIRLPGDEAFMHIARQPYVRAGRLYEVLAYPHDPRSYDRGSPDAKSSDSKSSDPKPLNKESFEPARFKAALEAVGLHDLVPRLDEDARWDQELGDQDLQRLAFARLSLQRPPWIVIDQALEALDDETHDQVLAMLRTSLEASAVINIGRAKSDDVFTRNYTLVLNPEGCRLPAADEAPVPRSVKDTV